MIEHISTPIQYQLDAMEEIIRERVVSSVLLATEVVRYAAGSGGKRVRPITFLLAAKLAGAREESLPSVAAAFELVHTASLLHDDIVDDAMVRRGAPAVRAKWGNQMSVLVGDFLWCSATNLILECGPERLVRVVAEAVTATTEGELLEITRRGDAVLDRTTYLKIIEGKTAALFAACAQAAAIMAEVPREFEDALRSYGHHVGMAFQLTDDVLDYGEDPKGGDISVSFLKDRARHHADAAKRYLDAFKPSVERDALSKLADHIVHRNA